MKKILFILAMVVSFSAFSSNPVLLDHINFKVDVFEQNINNLEVDMFNDDYVWIATCSVTIRNRNTGETREVSGSGYGQTRDEARDRCAADARRRAGNLVRELNDVQ